MKFTRKDKRNALEKEITEIHAVLKTLQPFSPEYTTTADNLEKLYKMNSQPRVNKVSPDTIALILGNMAIAVAIIGYEQGHVLTTKALGMFLRGRV